MAAIIQEDNVDARNDYENKLFDLGIAVHITSMPSHLGNCTNCGKQGEIRWRCRCIVDNSRKHTFCKWIPQIRHNKRWYYNPTFISSLIIRRGIWADLFSMNPSSPDRSRVFLEFCFMTDEM